MERGRWNIGFIVPPGPALRDAAVGLAFAAVLIGIADVIVLATTSMRHTAGSGFPWNALWVIYIPAAIHEEVVFRGYLFQRAYALHRGAGIAISSIVFATLHANNVGVTWIAMLNLLLAGVFLALAWERHRRLWLPIGIHVGWNFAEGGIFGVPTSGFASTGIVRGEIVGPEWLSGGIFGPEASIVAVLVCLALGTALLARAARRDRFVAASWKRLPRPTAA